LQRGERRAEKNPECSGARLSLWGEASFFSWVFVFFAKKKVRERRVGSSSSVIKGENSQKDSLHKFYVIDTAAKRAPSPFKRLG